MNLTPTVCVVDDDLEVRRFVGQVASSVGCRSEVFSSAEEFIAGCSVCSRLASTREPEVIEPSCVLLELRLPGMNGLELQEYLLRFHGHLPLIFIAEQGEVWAAVQATKRGALDFLEKPLQIGQLTGALRAAWDEVERHRSCREQENLTQLRLSTLTVRENQVLEGLLRHEPVKQIAAQLGTSPHTVRNQRASVLRKMGAQDDAELVAMILSARTGPTVRPF